MPPAQPASKLLDDDWMEFLDKAVDPKATSKDCNGDNSVVRAGGTTLQGTTDLFYFILLFVHLVFSLFVCNQFHTLPFFSCAPARFQQLSSESKKLSINVEHIIAQVSQAVNMNCGTEENFLLKEFDGNNPVTLPKLSDVVSARGLKHVWSEIKAFQELLKQHPV
jgi:hypothetical protein